MVLMNSPEVKLAIVGVSRDSWPVELARARLGKLVSACEAAGQSVYACETILRDEKTVLTALREVEEAGANAAVIYLGNFGPEGPISIFAQRFAGPVMVCGAAE